MPSLSKFPVHLMFVLCSKSPDYCKYAICTLSMSEDPPPSGESKCFVLLYCNVGYTPSLQVKNVQYLRHILFPWDYGKWRCWQSCENKTVLVHSSLPWKVCWPGPLKKNRTFLESLVICAGIEKTDLWRAMADQRMW